MSNETLFWGFIDDLKVLGDDVKAQVLFGGCRWCEPSPIPDVVERLSKLDYKEIENIFPMVICNDMAKKRLQEEVCLLFNYHSECSQDLAYSEIDKVSLYARWLNRFILICGKFGMTDIIPLSKQDDSGTSDKNIQKGWSQDLINLFNGHSDLIDDVAMLDSDDDKLEMICRMSKQRYSAEDRTMKCKLPFDRLQMAWARALIENKIISAKSAESLSKRFNKFK